MYHQSSCFMDYLHGDVRRDEAELACAYKYAHESKELRQLVQTRDKISQKNPNMVWEKLVFGMVQRSAMHGRPHPIWEWCFLMCGGFPAKDWNELSEPE